MREVARDQTLDMPDSKRRNFFDQPMESIKFAEKVSHSRRLRRSVSEKCGRATGRWFKSTQAHHSINAR
jgi:hypothetical protein